MDPYEMCKSLSIITIQDVAMTGPDPDLWLNP